MILCHTVPFRWKDVNQYKLLIIQTVTGLSDKSWLHCDIAFRKEVAAVCSTDWSGTHPGLYNSHKRSLATTSAALGTSISSALSLTEPLASSGNPQSSQYCNSWNDDGRCRWPFGRCRFRHSCETFHGDSPRIHCPHCSARRERPRSPSPSKGVTAVARPPLLANSAVHSFDSVLVGSQGNFYVLPSPSSYQQQSPPSSGYFLRSPAVCLLRPVSQLAFIDVDRLQHELRNHPHSYKVAYVIQGFQDGIHLHFRLQLQYFLEVADGEYDFGIP